MGTRMLAGWTSIGVALALWAAVLGLVAAPLGQWLSNGGLARPAAVERQDAQPRLVILR